MSFSYKPLWDLLERENISKMQFASAIDISNTTLAKLSKNEAVNLNIIDKICNYFKCRIEDVVQHVPDVSLNPLELERQQNLEVGYIITISDSNEKGLEFNKKFKYKYYVVTTKEAEPNLTFFGVIYNYTISPIVSGHRSPICLEFANIEIDGRLANGWIDLSTIRELSGVRVTIVGKMSPHIVNKINTFLNAIHNLNHDN